MWFTASFVALTAWFVSSIDLTTEEIITAILKAESDSLQHRPFLEKSSQYFL